MQIAFRSTALLATLAVGFLALRAPADPPKPGPKPQAPAPTAPASPSATERPEANASSAVRTRMPGINLREVALVDVFDFFRDAAGLNLYVNWPALEAAGIDRNTPITLRLNRVSLATVLDLTLRQAAHGDTSLTWYVSDNIVHITTKELAGRQLITLVYPVQDLLVTVPNFTAPEFNISSSGGGSGGGSSPPFSGSGNDNSTEEQGTMQERGERLVELIKMLVQPEVWVENGGFSQIRYFNGNLIVTAPRSVHLEIGGRR